MGIESKGEFSMLDGARTSRFVLSAQGAEILRNRGLFYLNEGNILILPSHQPDIGEKSVCFESQLDGRPVVAGKAEILFSAISRLTK